MNQNGVCPRIP